MSVPQLNPCIYIVSDGNFYKIGYSQNVQARLKQLQTAAATKLKLVHVIRCDRAPELVERRLHYMLKLNRVRGEWFRLTDEHIAFLKSYTNSAQLY